MQHGYKPRKFLWWYIDDHRDHDFIKTVAPHLGSVGIPDMPDVDNDRGLWMPDQNAFEPIFGNPPMPEGCTDYAQNDLPANYTGTLYNPAWTETHVHANENGGADMRVSFSSIINDGVQRKDGTIDKPFKQYLFVKAQGVLDWFAAHHASLFLGKEDKREISVGIKWWPEWVSPVNGSGIGTTHVGPDGILPDPDWSYQGFTWHDAVFCGVVSKNTKGQLIRNGEQFIKVKSWQGTSVGDNGFVYMSRPQANTTFAQPGTVSIIGSQVLLPGIQTINIAWVQYILSFVYMVANNYVLRPFGIV